MVPSLALAALLLLPAAQDHFKRAVELAQGGELKAAEAELRTAVKLAPDDALSLAYLGIVLTRQERLEEATAYLERALQIDPEDAGTRYNLAAIQFRLGRAARAKANLERILKARPEHQPSKLLLGMVLERMEEYERAASLLESVPELVRQQPESITALARAYYRTNRPQEARATLELLRTTYPDPVRFGYEIARVEYGAQRFAGSQSTLLELIAGGARDARIWNLLAWCHHRQNRPDDAVAAMARALELEPASSTHYEHLAQILIESGRSSAALDVLNKALELAPDSQPLYRWKGRAETWVGNARRALASYSRAVELNAGDPEALLGLGLAQQDLWQHAEAAATFERGMARFPQDARFYQAYGRMLLEAPAEQARGIALIEKALALDSALPEAHFELGRFLLANGKAEEAVPHLEAAAKLSPRESKMRLALANAYRNLGRRQDAARELRVYRELQER